MSRFGTFLAAAIPLIFSAAGARAADKVSLVLNWTIGADHAPIYWALKQGLYKQAGVDLSVEIGKGSGYASQRVGINAAQFGISDMPTAMQARGEGADLVGVLALYNKSPYTIYWKKSRGIKSIKDLPGHKIGTPPADAARQMWPAIAKAAGIDAASVSWVNIAPDAKFAALQSNTIDVTTNFYNIHFVGERLFGDDLGFLRLSEIGFNPYGNAFFVNGGYAKDHPDAVKNFVRVTQKAYLTCIQTPQPCLQAVVEAASQDPVDLDKSWKLTTELMGGTKGQVFGAFEPERVSKDYELIKTTFGTKPYSYESIFSNQYLDPSAKN
jgi:NitT/TauT family transport system substrate-binding protein